MSTGFPVLGEGSVASNYIWSSTYDHKKKKNKKKKQMNKLIVNQDVLLRTPITQVRRHIDVGTSFSNRAQHVPHQENISYLNPRTWP
jgi:hypothetical protein